MNYGHGLLTKTSEAQRLSFLGIGVAITVEEYLRLVLFRRIEDCYGVV